MLNRIEQANNTTNNVSDYKYKLNYNPNYPLLIAESVSNIFKSKQSSSFILQYMLLFTNNELPIKTLMETLVVAKFVKSYAKKKSQMALF